MVKSDRPQSIRQVYKHDTKSRAATSPFFSDLLKDSVYYLGIEGCDDDTYRCYIWHSIEIELVTFDNESYMNEFLQHCKKVYQRMVATVDCEWGCALV